MLPRWRRFVLATFQPILPAGDGIRTTSGSVRWRDDILSPSSRVSICGKGRIRAKFFSREERVAMSDDPRQEPAADGSLPPAPAHAPFPAQESFGPPFPEIPAAPPSPPAFTPPPSEAPSGLPPGTPPPYGAAPGPLPDAPGVQVAFAGPTPYGYAVPTQALYGPPTGTWNAPPRPLALGEALRRLPRQYWNILTHPKAATFAWEQGKAAWDIVWIELLILAVVESLVILALLFLEFFLVQLILPSNAATLVSQVLPIAAIIAVLFCLVFVPISFFCGSGIFYLMARAFGGQGSFLSHTYCYALITVPIGLLSMAISIIPCIGSLAGFAGLVYSIVLLVFMMMGCIASAAARRRQPYSFRSASGSCWSSGPMLRTSSGSFLCCLRCQRPDSAACTKGGTAWCCYKIKLL
jgi:hypothetical protein